MKKTGRVSRYRAEEYVTHKVSQFFKRDKKKKEMWKLKRDNRFLRNLIKRMSSEFGHTKNVNRHLLLQLKSIRDKIDYVLDYNFSKSIRMNWDKDKKVRRQGR